MTARRDDWQERLNALRDKVHERPFHHQRWNCAHWAAAAVKAQTGTDQLASLRHKFRTTASAKRALVEFKGDKLAGKVTQLLGEPVPTAYAGDGDIVLGPDGLGVAMARGNGEFVGEGGLIQLLRADWLKAWKV